MAARERTLVYDTSLHLFRLTASPQLVMMCSVHRKCVDVEQFWTLKKFCHLNGIFTVPVPPSFMLLAFFCTILIPTVILKRNKKYDFELWPSRIEDYFSFLLNYRPVCFASHVYSQTSKHSPSKEWRTFEYSDNPVDDKGKPTKDFEPN